MNCTFLDLHYVYFIKKLTFCLCVILVKELYNKAFCRIFAYLTLICECTLFKYIFWIARDPRSMYDDIKRWSSMLADIGHFLNPSKSVLVNQGLDETVFLYETQGINSILENVSFAKYLGVMLLGSSHTSTTIRPQFQHKLSIFKAMTEKLSILDRHPVYILLRNCFSMPKLIYLLRSSSIFQHPDLHAEFDDSLKICATNICNVSFEDVNWIQATFPIRLGGIRLRRVSYIALPSYLASISASRSLLSEIVPPNSIAAIHGFMY